MKKIQYGIFKIANKSYRRNKHSLLFITKRFYYKRGIISLPFYYLYYFKDQPQKDFLQGELELKSFYNTFFNDNKASALIFFAA